MYQRGRTAVTALSGVDITIATGEVVAMMGPSGCGKSTLLYILSGIDTPTHGQVLLRGTPISDLDVEERAGVRRTQMGLLFQTHALLPGLTVAENVALPLALAGVERTTRTERAAALLEMVDLAGRASDLPDDLSGGQRQRVALARALITDPPVVLADEPTGSLDSATATAMLEALLRLLRVRNTALVMVTHDAQAAARADRVIRLRDGHLDHADQQRDVMTHGGGRA